jgi:DNA-binding transcriptional LysR family regulator
MLLRKLTDLHFVLCASPGYALRRPVTEAIEELPEQECLAHIYDPVWHLVGEGGEHTVKIVNPVYSSNSYLTLRKAAVHGRGIAMLPLRTVAADLEANRLQRVLPNFEGPARSLYAVHAPGSHTLKKVRILLDYVATWFARNP